MPEFTSYEPGTPSWVDHATKDLEASNSFYGRLFGWEADDQGEDMGHYTLMRKGGKTVAGSMPAMNESQPNAWVTYVSVDNADATVELAQEAGATVFVEPMDVSDIGRMDVFADPTGAAIGVWQPKSFIGAQLRQRGRGVRMERVEHPGPARLQGVLPRECLAGSPTTSTWAG